MLRDSGKNIITQEQDVAEKLNKFISLLFRGESIDRGKMPKMETEFPDEAIKTLKELDMNILLSLKPTFACF